MNFKNILAARLAVSPLLALLVGACPSCCMEESEDSEPSTEAPADLGKGLSVASEHGPEPADLSCLRKTTTPQSGKSMSRTLPAVAFGYRDEKGQPVQVPGLEIQIFSNNEIPDELDCGSNCKLAADLGDGRYSFAAPEEGWIAYRVMPRPAGEAAPSVLPTVELNFESAPDETFNLMLEGVLEGLLDALGFERDPQRTLVAGRLLDCNGAPVQGATVALYDANNEQLDGERGAIRLYLDEKGPNPELVATSATGQWSVANVPGTSGQVQVRAFDPQGHLVACEMAATAPGGFSVLRLRPMRADGPECFE